MSVRHVDRFVVLVGTSCAVYNTPYNMLVRVACFALLPWFPQEEGAEADYIGDYGDPSTVYPFGMDPAWHIADNEVRSWCGMVDGMECGPVTSGSMICNR